MSGLMIFSNRLKVCQVLYYWNPICIFDLNAYVSVVNPSRLLQGSIVVKENKVLFFES